jgi:hypothetical protein
MPAISLWEALRADVAVSPQAVEWFEAAEQFLPAYCAGKALSAAPATKLCPYVVG